MYCAAFLGALAKLREATISFEISVRPSVFMKKLSSHWTDFYYIWYLSIFRKSVEKICFLLKSDKNNGYIAWGPIYIYGNISLNSS